MILVETTATFLSHASTTTPQLVDVADKWGLDEAVAQVVAKVVREVKEVPKLLGKSLPATPAFSGKTEIAFEEYKKIFHILEIEQ